MNDNEKNIQEAVKDAYQQIEPHDSWLDLRERINSKINEKYYLNSIDKNNQWKSIIFWRRSAFVAAACFLIAMGMLVYTIWPSRSSENNQTAAKGKLFDNVQLEALETAFSQVRKLFGNQSGWIIIGSGENTQVGIVDRASGGAVDDKLVAVRLVINQEGENPSRQYCDIVTFSNEKTNFRLYLDNDRSIDIVMTPKIEASDKIALEISTQIKNNPPLTNVQTIANNAYTSLAQVKVNGISLTIEGIGQPISKI